MFASIVAYSALTAVALKPSHVRFLNSVDEAFSKVGQPAQREDLPRFENGVSCMESAKITPTRPYRRFIRFEPNIETTLVVAPEREDAMIVSELRNIDQSPGAKTQGNGGSFTHKSPAAFDYEMVVSLPSGSKEKDLWITMIRYQKGTGDAKPAKEFKRAALNLVAANSDREFQEGTAVAAGIAHHNLGFHAVFPPITRPSMVAAATDGLAKAITLELSPREGSAPFRVSSKNGTASLTSPKDKQPIFSVTNHDKMPSLAIIGIFQAKARAKQTTKGRKTVGQS